jgi:hypothetical protein
MPRRPHPARRIDAPPLPSSVRVVPSPEARVLQTISPDDPVWRGGAASCAPGAIVRIRPPADASNADVERLINALRRAGAVRCRAEPRAASAEVLTRPERPAKAERRTIREVVERMVAESRAHDREALAATTDEALTEEGL